MIGVSILPPPLSSFFQESSIFLGVKTPVLAAPDTFTRSIEDANGDTQPGENTPISLHSTLVNHGAKARAPFGVGTISLLLINLLL